MSSGSSSTSSSTSGNPDPENGGELTGPPRRISGVGWAAAFVLVSMLFAFVWFQLKHVERGHREPTTLMEIYGDVPDFEFLSQTGEPYGSEDLDGKIWVSNFIFTRCAGPCPLITSRMVELQAAVGRKTGDDVRLISVTVDPEYDTPEVLRQYADNVRTDDDLWRFLTGPEDDIREFVLRGMMQSLGEEPDGTPLHSTRFVVVDEQGRIRSLREGTHPEVVAQLLMDIGTLMRERDSAARRAARQSANGEP